MKILILGGTGLISTQITHQLLARSDVALTHYNRGQRIQPFGGGAFVGAFKTIVGDRYHHAAFEQQMAEAGLFDCVLDMIGFAPADVESATRAFKGRCGQFIFCSTVDVYAHPQPNGQLPYSENTPHKGLNSYAQNKVLCEQILQAAHARGDFPLTLIRPAATYAEGANVLHSFRGKTTYLDRLRKGKPIIVHGDGQSLWCSCHASDVARAFVNAVCNPVTYGKTYHTTGEEFLTWNQHHHAVARALGAPEPQLVHIPTDLLERLLPERAHWTATNFQYNNIFDNRAAKQELDFRYTIRWEEGARRLTAWLEAHGKIENSDDDPFDDQLIALWQKLGDALAQAWAKTNFH